MSLPEPNLCKWDKFPIKHATNDNGGSNWNCSVCPKVLQEFNRFMKRAEELRAEGVRA
jgi:hypothetical protein